MNTDIRFGYRFGLPGNRRIELNVDLFNATNHVNFANPSGNQGAPASFLVLSAYSTSYAPRKLQFGVAYRF